MRMTTFQARRQDQVAHGRSAGLPAPGSLTTANVEIISQRLAAQVNRGDTEARVEHFCRDEHVVPFVFPGLCHAADGGLKDIARFCFLWEM